MRLSSWARGVLVAGLLVVGATELLAVNDHKSEYLHNATGTTASASALNGTALDTTGYTALGLQVVISDTATVSFQGTVDNTNWVAVGCVKTSDTNTATVTSVTASTLLQCNVAGLAQFRAPASGLTAGTVTVKGRLTTGPWSKRGGGGSNHDLLDGSVAQDTVAAAVSRGSLVVGNSTPKWGELVIGAANRVLTSDGTDAAWGQVVSAMLNITTTSCTNQFVTAVSATGVGTCTTPTLAGAQFANQGTTTTVLHGNGAGNPSFGAVSLTADVSGITPTANGGTGIAYFTAAGPTVARVYTFPDAATTIVGTDTTQTLTGKTYDTAGTGNVFTAPAKVWFPAAGCNNATASTMWDLPTSNGAAPACVTGTNTQKGVLDFDATTSESAQQHLMLPADWTGALDVSIKWFAAATSGGVVWAVQTICVADAETDDPAFNTASTVTDAAKGTTNQTNDASITGVTATGCAAGELLHLKISRSVADAGDDMTGDARLIGMELTLRRAM